MRVGERSPAPTVATIREAAEAAAARATEQIARLPHCVELANALKPLAPPDGATQNERYRLLVESLTDYALYMLDPAGFVSSWNPGAQRLKGYEQADIIGEHFSKFYTDDDRAAGLPQRALQIAAQEGRFEGEGWHVRKDGGRFWANVVIDPIRGDRGELIGFAKVTRDLTERRERIAELEDSERQLRLLVQGVTDYAIYTLDPTGRVSNWNAGAERIKGYAAAEIVGQNFSKFYTAEDRDAGEPQRALAVASSVGRFEKEGWRVRKNGERFWAHVVIDAIRGEDGALLGFAKVTRDATERRNSQIALQAAQEQLMQAQKMEAIGQLTGGIAHDFNNLLMAILGSLELARKRLPDDPMLIRLVGNAVHGAERGAALTQRMLAFARRQELKSEPVDVIALVHGMADLLRRTLGQNVRIETHFPVGLRRALADANQLELVLLNLAINARDAMPEGGVVAMAARERRLAEGDVTGVPPGNYVVVTVSDTGHGMDAATLARAAEPFFTTKGPGKGTGLGLSLVHGVMEQLGGRLILKSEPDRGTTAELWLPAVEAAAAQPEAAPATLASAGRSEPLTVLCVDDDVLVLMNTVEMVRDLGHTVFEARNGGEALAVLRAEPIDLVITDQGMPGMTGLQLVAKLQGEGFRAAVIVATGYAELPGDAGAIPHRLNKPFTQRALAAAISAATV